MSLADPDVHRMSTAEFDRIVATGALEDVPVELIDGLLVDVTPQGTEHSAVISALTRWLGQRLDLLRIQQPLACADGWQPEPDVALAPSPGSKAHAKTAALVVEVVVTQRREAERKLPGYAMAGVAQVWLVDVPRRAVVVHRAPEGREWSKVEVLRGDDVLDPEVDGIPPRTVDELLEAADL